MEALEAADRTSLSSEHVFHAACRDVAEATGANRVSIWDFSDRRDSVHCVCFYDASTDSFTKGQVLTAEDLPTYFRVILKEKYIVAPDARSHAATAELVDPYFRDHDIYSLLDFIIHENFKPIGVICCENAGAIRDWQEEDISYLRQISTLISFRLKRS